MWHGRGKYCGLWLPELKKASMWHGRGKCCGLWLPELKKLVCGMEGENVVANGHLPSPRSYNPNFLFDVCRLETLIINNNY